MVRYWFEFLDADAELPPGARLGVGVTASDPRVAEARVRTAVFGGGEIPRFRIAENVNVSQLDELHVRANMGDPTVPGIWFPQGY